MFLCTESIAIDKQNDNINLRISNNEYKRYVAFSHVWVHGLGNPKANSLPECQLRRLKSLSTVAMMNHNQRVHPDGDVPVEEFGPFFWIDTLCVPTSPKGRRRALKLLANAYEGATITLVIDTELCATPSSCSPAERAARVLTSAWVRRLWTLDSGRGTIGDMGPVLPIL